MGAPRYDLISFDCDGTLTDTGPTHVVWCNDVNADRNCRLPMMNVGDPVAVRRILGTPMETIIRNYGFPEAEIAELVKLYDETFSKDIRYTSPCFPGIPRLISAIRRAGITSGVVTSNVFANVVRDLGVCADGFTEYIDKKRLQEEGWKKSHALRWMQDYFGSQRPVYIGDTRKDAEAAEEAGFPFIWVKYGWEIPPQNQPNAPENVGQLAELLGIGI